MAIPMDVRGGGSGWRGGWIAAVLLAGCGAWTDQGEAVGEAACDQDGRIETGVASDLALLGPGYFVLTDPATFQESLRYTRLGQFTFDQEGYLVNLDGLRVQGFQDEASSALAGLGGLRVLPQSMPPKPTATVVLRGNLDGGAPLLGPFEPANPCATANLATSVAVYDSLGALHPLQVFFTRAGPGAWDWHAMDDGAALEGGSGGLLTVVAEGALTFDGAGRLAAEHQASSFDPRGARLAQPLAFDLGDPTSAAPPGPGYGGMTQFAAASSMTFAGQDGAPTAFLTDVRVDADGRVLGLFSTGDILPFGRIAVATFASPVLERRREDRRRAFSAAPGSHPAAIGFPCQDGNGCIASGVLEWPGADPAACR